MIDIRGFSKYFGSFCAVNDLWLKIERGDVFGYIGPNGAGKTTTLKFLATLLKPTQGEAFIAGHSVTREVYEVRRRVGYMPDEFGVYDGMRIWEYLDFFAAAYRITTARRKGIIDDVLQLLDLSHKRDDFVETLSRGMKQRLCLAKTLLHDPEVLVLDEPASGLDPRARIEIKELIKELRRMGKTIMISSHILAELADFCNKIGIIERGKLLAAGDIDEIREGIKEHRILEIELLDSTDVALRLIERQPGVIKVEPLGNVLRVEYAGNLDDIAAMHRALIEQGVQVVWFREHETGLEEIFMRVTKGEVI
ncbi:ABC transporter ATP-binding protein [Candidatus Sumerlaeota bacterium]|nr:ABC transporter ATP-binding protein [Candidatus Sumerlaeota bacterium]